MVFGKRAECISIAAELRYLWEEQIGAHKGVNAVSGEWILILQVKQWYHE